MSHDIYLLITKTYFVKSYLAFKGEPEKENAIYFRQAKNLIFEKTSI